MDCCSGLDFPAIGAAEWDEELQLRGTRRTGLAAGIDKLYAFAAHWTWKGVIRVEGVF